MGTNTRLPDLMLRSGVGCLFELGGRRFWSRPASAGYGMASPSPILRLALRAPPASCRGPNGQAPPALSPGKVAGFLVLGSGGSASWAGQLSGQLERAAEAHALPERYS